MFVVIRKRQVILTILLCIVLVATATLTAVLVQKDAQDAMAVTKKLLPVYAVNTTQKTVAITFDAAWGSDKTEKILEILDRYGVKATFFLVGFWIEANPDLTQEIASRGHLIGNHSANHPHMPTLTGDKMKEEILSVNRQIEELTATTPIYFRAPFGDYDNALLQTLSTCKMTCVQWDVDSLDWKGGQGKEIADRVLGKVKNGSIILCHNNSDHIVEALPLILLGIRSKGYQFVRLDELVATENYEIDNDGIQTKIS